MAYVMYRDMDRRIETQRATPFFSVPAGYSQREVVGSLLNQAVRGNFFESNFNFITVAPNELTAREQCQGALYRYYEQCAAWSSVLFQYTNAALGQARNGIRWLDSSKQAVRLLWNNANSSSFPAGSARDNRLIQIATRLDLSLYGALDVRTPAEFIAKVSSIIDPATGSGTIPTRAYWWISTAGTRVNLGQSHNYGPLNTNWNPLDVYWA